MQIRRFVSLGGACLSALGITPPASTARASGPPEVITVTDSTAAIVWETTTPAKGTVRFRAQPGDLSSTVEEAAGDRRWHQCRLSNLRPGTQYHFTCEPTDDPAARSGSFTTLTPPPGREMFSFATLTDTHVGQTLVGRVVLQGGRVLFPGVQWREPQVPLWRVAILPGLEEINDYGVAFTIVKGDVTHGLSPDEFPAARGLLAHLRRPCHIVRGNHDQREPLLRTFQLERPWYSFDLEGFHFVVLDTEPLLESRGTAREEQLRWLAADLGRHRDRWTLVFLHRPIQPNLARNPDDELSKRMVDTGSRLLERVASPTAARALRFAAGRLQDVPEPQARRLADLFARHGRVVGVFAGHVHRDYVGAWPEATGNLPYVETAAAGEYPCGYAITRVFTGGYMHNFYMPDDADCLEWSSTTRVTFERMGLTAKAGTLADRNLVIRFGELDLSPRERR